MKRLLLLLCVLTWPALAHEVHHRIEASEAVVVTLGYANGAPFAYEKYALTPVGEDTPRQVGNTDAHGRIAFVPGDIAQWRVQATSADGHGVTLEFVAPRTADAAATESAVLPRWLLAGCGLSAIFGLFGLFQLFARKRG